MKNNRKITPLNGTIQPGAPGMTYAQLVLAWEGMKGKVQPALHAAVKQMVDDSVRLTFISEAKLDVYFLETPRQFILRGSAAGGGEVSSSADLRMAIDLAMRKQP